MDQASPVMARRLTMAWYREKRKLKQVGTDPIDSSVLRSISSQQYKVKWVQEGVPSTTGETRSQSYLSRLGHPIPVGKYSCLLGVLDPLSTEKAVQCLLRNQPFIFSCLGYKERGEPFPFLAVRETIFPSSRFLILGLNTDKAQKY